MRRAARGSAMADTDVSASQDTWTTLVAKTLDLTGGTQLDIDCNLSANVSVGGAIRVLLDATVLTEETMRTGTDAHYHTIATASIPRTASPTTYVVTMQVQGEGLASSVTCNAVSDPRHRAVLRYAESK